MSQSKFGVMRHTQPLKFEFKESGNVYRQMFVKFEDNEHILFSKNDKYGIVLMGGKILLWDLSKSEILREYEDLMIVGDFPTNLRELCFWGFELINLILDEYDDLNGEFIVSGNNKEMVNDI